MIERISGKLIEKTPTFCVVDCHGVGIGVHISLNTFQQIERYGAADAVALHTYLHVREDILQLYGFYDGAEKQLFQLLISISGVGPKMALAVLSGSSTAELRQAIALENVDMLIRIPGVGKKTAQRLVLELKEKIQKQPDISTLPEITGAPPETREKINEAMLALVGLGFKAPEVQRAIDRITRRQGLEISIEDLVKMALKELR